MQRRKKGLIVFLFLLIFSCTLYAQDDLSFQVPSPPEGSLQDSKVFSLGTRQINAELYTTAKDKQSIYDYYQDFFKKEGFLKILDNFDHKRHLLRFRKGDLVASIAIMPKQANNTEVTIAKYLQPPGAPDPEKMKPSVKDPLFALPKEDVRGKDLSLIPRPPESVRMMYLERGKETYLIYTTTLNVPGVVNFYQENMSDKGWNSKNVTAAQDAVEAYKQTSGKKDLGVQSPFSDGEDFAEVIRDSYLLSFIGDNGEAKITIFPNFIDRKLGSMVQIVYRKE